MKVLIASLLILFSNGVYASCLEALSLLQDSSRQLVREKTAEVALKMIEWREFQESKGFERVVGVELVRALGKKILEQLRTREGLNAEELASLAAFVEVPPKAGELSKSKIEEPSQIALGSHDRLETLSSDTLVALLKRVSEISRTSIQDWDHIHLYLIPHSPVEVNALGEFWSRLLRTNLPEGTPLPIEISNPDLRARFPNFDELVGQIRKIRDPSVKTGAVFFGTSYETPKGPVQIDFIYLPDNSSGRSSAGMAIIERRAH